MPDLTIAQLQEILASAKPDEREYLDSFSFQMAHQLIATMQREAKLLAGLEFVLTAGRGSSGRIILERHQEERLREITGINLGQRNE